ncbi:MAG: hypothetical protein MR787_07780 [Bacteroidales bacterium]|nr:hypothetical protein [Bacteroidales bacterium]
MKIVTKHNLFLIIMIFLYVAITIFCIIWEFNPYLWFDEAGQFWIAKGLNHDSDALSPSGTILDVIENNKHYNLDPGGFGIILHLWSCVSNHYIWLRMLPFIFFGGIVYVFYYLAYHWTHNKNITLLVSLFPLISSVLFPMAFEVRAYSMEALGVTLSVVALTSLRQKVSLTNLLKWSVVLSFFMLSRYSFIIVAFFASLYVLFLILTSAESTRKKVVQCIVYALPFLITLVYIYFAALRYQNPDIEPLSYLKDSYLIYNPNKLKWDNNFIYILFLIGLSYLWFISWKIQRLNKYAPLLYLTVSVNIIFLILSLMGKHPWDIQSNRCISMITLSLLTIAMLCAELICRIDRVVDIKYLLLFLFVLYFGNTNRKVFKPRNDTLLQISHVDLYDKKIYADRWESPCLRYQIEYGILKGKIKDYPNNYYAQKGQKHGKGIGKENNLPSEEWRRMQPALNQLVNYDILFVPELSQYKQEECSFWEPIDSTKAIVWVKKPIEN